MVGYKSHVGRYFSISGAEWQSLLITAIFGGFIFSFGKWGVDGVVNVGMGLYNLILATVAVFFLMAVQLTVTKLIGVRYGIIVSYDKYLLGLLVGVFIAFLSFGFIPFFITGKFTFSTIANLRVGKFRSKLVKNWEAGVISLAAIMTPLLLTIIFHLFELVTGLAIFHRLIVIAFALTIFTLLPLPLIETANPYTVYMSRLESLQGNTPGYDLFFASRLWYTFVFVMTVIFAILGLVLGPSFLPLLVSMVLGFAAMFLYSRIRFHFAGPN